MSAVSRRLTWSMASLVVKFFHYCMKKRWHVKMRLTDAQGNDPGSRQEVSGNTACCAIRLDGKREYDGCLKTSREIFHYSQSLSSRSRLASMVIPWKESWLPTFLSIMPRTARMVRAEAFSSVFHAGTSP